MPPVSAGPRLPRAPLGLAGSGGEKSGRGAHPDCGSAGTRAGRRRARSASCSGPAAGEDPDPPFAAVDYRPSYLGKDVIRVADGTRLEEPGLFYLGFLPPRASPAVRADFELPDAAPVSPALQKLELTGLATFRRGPRHALTLTLAGDPRERADLRPELPVLPIGAPVHSVR